MNREVMQASAEANSVRRNREFRTIAAMLRMYCRAHHAPPAAPLCPACRELHDYAQRRLDRCVFGEAKPTCANCTVHCYKASMREQIRQVMVWAGPRMLWRHPVLAIRHLMIDGRRPAPTLTTRKDTTRQSRRAPAE
ncbi:MAG TPA: nitrous oxide-stimulated promoter family protein [Acetobacteraceae bacterium]|nr:nitrous oxide-stimulated promoter family protein [Acetobacteraceae bacterium]